MIWFVSVLCVSFCLCRKDLLSICLLAIGSVGLDHHMFAIALLLHKLCCSAEFVVEHSDEVARCFIPFPHSCYNDVAAMFHYLSMNVGLSSYTADGASAKTGFKNPKTVYFYEHNVCSAKRHESNLGQLYLKFVGQYVFFTDSS